MKHIGVFITIMMLLAGVSFADWYEQFIHESPDQGTGYLQQYLKIKNKKPLKGRYAIIIAIGEYDHLTPLSAPAKDAQKMKNFLLNHDRYDEVVVLEDEDATKTNISYFMETYFPKKMASRGRYQFLFYFSGHGGQQPGYDDEPQGFLQLKGATGEVGDPNVIHMSQVEIWANRMRYAKQALFVLDCCFSGLAGVEQKTFDTSLDPVDLAEENGRFMITAGDADEVAIAGDKWNGSLFTAVAIEGMSGRADSNRDGVVTTYELFSYVDGGVKFEAKRKNRTQTPRLRNLGGYDDRGQYFFVYRSPNPTDYQMEDDPTLEHKGQNYTETLPGNIPMPMVYIPGGSFKIGSDEGSDDEKNGPTVTLDGFYMAATEVTQAQYQAIMGENPSNFKGDNLPVETVTWHDAVEFCEKLSQMTGRTYRLPTEAEWEYAARGGTKSRGFTYSGGNDPDAVGWYSSNSKSSTHPVGEKQANELGLFDMSGNVWEWCADNWHDSYVDLTSNGQWDGVGNTQRRVVRGGSWNYLPNICRAANRNWNLPVNRYDSFGFRVVSLSPRD